MLPACLEQEMKRFHRENDVSVEIGSRKVGGTGFFLFHSPFLVIILGIRCINCASGVDVLQGAGIRGM